MTSVLQPWVMELPLREQGTLLTAVRGCDLVPKYNDDGTPRDSMERRLTAWIRWAFMVPADEREIDIPGAFYQSRPPEPFKASALMHYPGHWLTHVMHALEVIGYRHPSMQIAVAAHGLYIDFVDSMHLSEESKAKMIRRLSEDRIANGTVVS